jgi:hypothetical protein
MIDHENTCKNIYVQYLTSTFISRSNLGQNPLKVTKPAHSDLRTLYVLVSITPANVKQLGLVKLTFKWAL